MMPYSNIRTVCRHDHECCILIVDNEEEVLQSIKATFKTQPNIKILTADSLHEALEIIPSTPNLELVLLDLWLENKNPAECLQKVVKATNNRVAVIGISGDYALEDIAFDNGAVDFWRKPFVIDVIGRTKLSIINMRIRNLLLDTNIELQGKNTKLIEELEIIRGNIKTDPDSAIEELDLTNQELKQEGQVLKRELQVLMMRAN